ncbi:MAG: poly(R)-hydroxyalkanoic acid synthase subunit PhaE, partial [bacterium]
TKIVKNWMEAGENLRRTFQGETARSEPEATQKAHDLRSEWLSISNSWASSMRDVFDNMMNTLSRGIGRETLANIFSSAETYMKLFEWWMPIYKSLQEKTFDPAAYQSLFDSKQYQEVLDKVFDFISPGAAKEFYDQAIKYLETVAPLAPSFTKQFADLAQSGARMYAGMLTGDFDAALKSYENILDEYKRSLGPMFKLPKFREHVDLTLNLLRKFPAFMAQYAKYQGLMHTTGRKTMEKVMAQFAQKMKDPAAAPSYDEFFKIWAAANERAYNELFNAEAFTALQNEVHNTGLDMKRDFQQLLELALAPYPVVLRSEMDELYKTVHDLKKRVHDLEKETNR